MIYILKVIEGNTVSYIKYKTLQEAEQQLVMWQKEDMGPQTIQYIRLLHGKARFLLCLQKPTIRQHG